MVVIEKGVLKQEKLCIKWEIKNFFGDCKNVGDAYKSSTFSTKYNDQTINWHLQVYPKGSETETNRVSVFLIFESQSVAEVTVDYTFSIVSQQNNDLFTCRCQHTAMTFKHPQDGWGVILPEQIVLKNTEYGALINDSLKISCEITVCQTFQDKVVICDDYNKLLSGVEKELEDYEKLLDVNYFSDVTFDIKGEKMYLHKAILMCRNPVFKAMFEHDMKENKQSSVDITDIDYEVMRELFRFIYSGKVNKIEEIAKDLLIAADKYDVTKLKALCEKKICDILSIDNAIEYLKFTEMCNTIHLKKLIIKFIVDNLKDIVRESNFNSLFAEIDREVVCELMEAIADKN